MEWKMVLDHLILVLFAVLFTILIGLPVGLCAYLFTPARKIILRAVDILQTIPSLALLGMVMTVFGAGKLTVVIGLVLYSMLPVVTNTYVGLTGVTPGIKEAACGCGMSKLYSLARVEFPIAFPMIFTGIRIAAVTSIGSAVFAVYVGGGGLGSIIHRGIRIQNLELILSGTLALMVMAIVIDSLMGFVQRRLERGPSKSSTKERSTQLKKLASLLLVFVLTAMLAGCAKDEGAKTIVTYDGKFTEVRIIDRMVKLLVEQETDLTVKIGDEMSGVNQLKEMLADKCDFMVSYDGSLLTTYLKLDPEDVPEGEVLYDFVNKKGPEMIGVLLLDKLGINNTYSVGVRQEIAEKYKLTNITELAAVAGELRFGAEHEFFSEEGSMKFGPFTKFYGIDFKDSKSIDQGLKYAAIESGQLDVMIVYTTDGLNRKAKLVVLEDDRSFFPEYNGALQVRTDFFDKYKTSAPNLESVLSKLSGILTNEIMTDLTYQCDVEGKSYDSVALEFMKSVNLVK